MKAAPATRRVRDDAKGFKEAYAEYRDGGWQGLCFDPDYGGQGLPYIIAVAFNEMVSAANMAFAMYPGLARGAAAAIEEHGTDEQKAPICRR